MTAAPAPRYLTSRRDTIAVVAAVVLGLIVLWAFRFRGWYPHDEGTLGQAAERILRGQIPHRDYDDPYTGGLGLLHSLVFRMGGVSANAIRSHLALVATAWFGGMFWLLTHWLRPTGAAVVAALIAVLSVPLYPAAMPSWYVLFFACAAGAVLVLLPRRTLRAPLLAGILIGIGALAKVSAIFALAGAVWGLVAIRQHENRERRGAIEVIVGAAIFGVLVMRLVGSLLDGRVFFHLALPPILIVAGIAFREIQQGRARGFGVDTVLWRRIAMLAVGAALPVAVYAFWLARNDALTPFIASLGAVVGKRSASASLPPPSVRSILYALPLIVILFAASKRFHVRRIFIAGGGFALAVIAWFYPYVHANFWQALRGIVPAGALLFAIYWVREQREHHSRLHPTPQLRRATANDARAARALTPGDDRAARPPSPVATRAVLVFVPLTGMMVLSQYPFAATIYFLYILPLLLLAISAVVALRPARTQASAGWLALVYLLFGIVEVIPGSPDSLGMSADHAPKLAWLNVPRARLLVPPDDVNEYRAVVAALDSIPAGPIWAGPDAPEVAFLAGRVDLNRSFFVFVTSEAAPGATFAAQLAARGAQAVVADTAPSFSAPLTAEALDSVSRYFPQVRTIGRFRIHSRAGGP